MATISPLVSFILGFLIAVVVIVIFYFSARLNQSAVSLYRQTFCASIL